MSLNLNDRNARVGFSHGLTFQVGGHTFVKPSVSIEIDVMPDEDVEELMNDLEEEVLERLLESVDKLVNFIKDVK